MDKYPQRLIAKANALLGEFNQAPWLLAKNPGKDFSRNRVFSPSVLLHTLIGMGGSSLPKEMLNCFNFHKNTPSASAFVQQRHKLRDEAMEFVFSRFVERFPCRKTMDGFRLIACDGSDLCYYANPDEHDNYFRRNSKSKAYNLLHLNACYDLLSNRYVDAVIQGRRQANERKAFITMIDRTPVHDKVIFLADRGFESFNVLAHIIERRQFFLLRVRSNNGILTKVPLPTNQQIDMNCHAIITRKPISKSLKNAELYHWIPNNTPFDFCPPHTNSTYPMDFRIVVVEIQKGNWEYLVTNLDPEHFPPSRLKSLYAMRWGIETSFRDLKYTIGLSNFHTKKAEFVAQEVFARLILYNLCELVVSHTALFTKNNSHTCQLNFSLAVHVFRQAFLLAPYKTPPDVAALIRKQLLPIRPNRSSPRPTKHGSIVAFVYRVC